LVSEYKLLKRETKSIPLTNKYMSAHILGGSDTAIKSSGELTSVMCRNCKS
jgi:hypothetical protein